jgi:hypothetical protein
MVKNITNILITATKIVEVKLKRKKKEKPTLSMSEGAYPL